ncbi:hypothetical protein [Streptomyces sp. A012304]|uniref:hypothetical protein n=1 Tax=Streptomyces sp. A012304 TaxID=375446 RepID=UPI0022308545|nr:hypothetical protein [Streptomyces sp. A012304]GKQ37179.1 hypothetical protein ALMP_37180 [Streptomyces sp. A012304]
MPQRTQPEQQPAIPERTVIGWCAWHEAYSNTARPVRDSSGARLFACVSCRQAYDLVPIGDQP